MSSSLSERRRDLVVEHAGTLAELLARAQLDVALIRSGGVFVAGKRCREPSERVEAGTRIVVHLAAPAAVEAHPPAILYEDEAIIVVDKAPGQHVNETETSAVVSLVERLEDKNAYTVHRIDRETSGVVLLARSRAMADTLAREFRERRVKKTYLAIVKGSVPDQTIRAPIGKDRLRPRARAVTPDGKPAETVVRTLGRAGEVSAIEARPITGRTHQIRVHLAHQGAPIAGDLLYGGVAAVRAGGRVFTVERVMLHAMSLSIEVGGEERTFRAAIPEDMLRFQDAGLPLGSIIA